MLVYSEYKPIAVTKTKDEHNPTREIGSNFKASFKSRGVVSDELVGFSGFCLDMDRSAEESAVGFLPFEERARCWLFGLLSDLSLSISCFVNYDVALAHF